MSLEGETNRIFLYQQNSKVLKIISRFPWATQCDRGYIKEFIGEDYSVSDVKFALDTD